MSDVMNVATVNELTIEEQSLPIKTTQLTEAEIKENIAKKVYDKLDYWMLHPSMSVVRDIEEMSWNAKANIRNLLRNHPNWNESQQAIIFEESYNAATNSTDIACFGEWCKDNLIYAEFFKSKIVFNFNGSGMSLREIYKVIDRKQEELGCAMYSWNDYYMTKKDYDEFKKVRKFFENGNAFSSSVVDSDFVAEVTELGVPEIIPPIGQKLSRAVRKICSYYGLDKIVNMMGVKHNGVTQQKDYGWNYHFAMFGDAINPVHIQRFTAFSINLKDYITMSSGTNWLSCHFPDVNEVESYGGDCYHYCHASGPMSYALDNSTVIFYTVSSNYVGDMCDAYKERRMNYHLAPDGKSFIFGRLYPDGRDGGETGLAAVFRRTVQKILAECLGTNNLWKFNKGTGGNLNHSDTVGTHYADYNEYSDTGYSYLQGTEMPIIRIGHNPICPVCGKEHDNCEDLRCYEHSTNYEKCCHCGENINTDRDDYYYCEEDGRYFCSRRCYENEGYIMCEDGHIHKKNKCCYDEYNEEWYYMDWYDGISPDGEAWYATRDNCEADGWIELETPNGDWEWYEESDTETDAYTGETICRDWDNVFTPNGTDYYLNTENAINDGWVQTIRFAENREVNEWKKC